MISSGQARLKFYEKEAERKAKRKELRFWILFTLLCVIAAYSWKFQILYALFIPVIRYALKVEMIRFILFSDMKKENEKINSKTGDGNEKK